MVITQITANYKSVTIRRFFNECELLACARVDIMLYLSLLPTYRCHDNFIISKLILIKILALYQLYRRLSLYVCLLRSLNRQDGRTYLCK